MEGGRRRGRSTAAGRLVVDLTRRRTARRGETGEDGGGIGDAPAVAVAGHLVGLGQPVGERLEVAPEGGDGHLSLPSHRLHRLLPGDGRTQA